MPDTKTTTTEDSRPRGKRLAVLSLTALGIVYGDIGTSPLYAIRECFTGEYGIEPSTENVYGVLSLIFWSLLLVVSLKYLTYILRADNRGEGGTIALMALLRRGDKPGAGAGGILVVLGLFGGSLLYGDGMITPAISVLSAVEGLGTATPAFEPFVVPITLGILVALFLFQSRGTAKVGATFGPVILVWFLTLGVLGLKGIASEPHVLLSVNPLHAVDFFIRNQLRGFLVLGSVFLVVTGSEALYADMGHFGRRPIRVTWFSFVLPALLLNYFGQGAHILREPDAAQHPFYHLVPDALLYPMVVLATAATVIASQAVISGAFSLSRQVMQLGYCPRMRIEHTSEDEFGQIYIPQVNWILMTGTLLLVIGFQSSSELAAAYGVAVTTTMLIASLLFFAVARRVWGWSLLRAGIPVAVFILSDLAFFGSNISKVAHGAWFPLLIGLGVFLVFTTWRQGRLALGRRFLARTVPLDRFIDDIRKDLPTRVPGTAVFMTSNAGTVPPALLHNLRHNKVLHETTILMTVETEQVPKIRPAERVHVTPLEAGIVRVEIRYGFMEDPDVPRALRQASPEGLDFKMDQASFFLGRERILTGRESDLPRWRARLFAFLTRNELGATAFFRIPPQNVVEVGAQVEI